MYFYEASDAYCLASAVSSKLLQAIAAKEGVNFIVSLLYIMAMFRMEFLLMLFQPYLAYFINFGT